MSEFDAKARDWDKNQQSIDRSEAVARALLQMVPVKTGMKALEYGSGTGTLSVLLKDRLADITLMDSSKEMTKVATEKIKALGIQNMKALYFDLEHEEFEGHFDIIYSQMVMHHVNDIEAMFASFYSLLLPGGYLAIADLYTEDGSFHGEGFNGHLGFDIDEFATWLKNSGFKNISHQKCHTMKRPDEMDKVKEFPIFLIVAVK